MNDNKLKEINKKINELHKNITGIEKDASCEYRIMLNDLEEEKKEIIKKAMASQKKDCLKMAKIVAEVHRLNFLLFVEFGFDAKVETTHHVKWIQHNINEYKYPLFATYGSSLNNGIIEFNFIEIREVLEEIKEKYIELG